MYLSISHESIRKAIISILVNNRTLLWEILIDVHRKKKVLNLHQMYLRNSADYTLLLSTQWLSLSTKQNKQTKRKKLVVNKTA